MLKSTAFFFSLILIASPAFADIPTDTTPIAISKPNVISFELLGRGIIYSLNYDRVLNDSISLGMGFSYLTITTSSTTTSYSASQGYQTSSSSSSASLTILPLYLNYYFNPNKHRPYLTGGVDLAFASGTFDKSAFSGTGVAGVAGGGYEYRGDSGFVFRGTAYILVGKSVLPWLGLSLGYAF